jgi:hypothetical protein
MLNLLFRLLFSLPDKFLLILQDPPQLPKQRTMIHSFYVFVCLFIYLSWWDWGLNSGLCTCIAGALSFKHYHFALVNLEIGSQELFACAICDPLDLSLPSFWDYRHE